MEGLIKILIVAAILIVILLIWLIAENSHFSSFIKHKLHSMALDLAKLQAAVENETSLDESIKKLIVDSANAIKEASDDQQKVNDIADQMIANAASLSAAAQLNTTPPTNG